VFSLGGRAAGFDAPEPDPGTGAALNCGAVALALNQGRLPFRRHPARESAGAETNVNMQSQWWFATLAGFALALGFAGDAAADGMRCGSRLVDTGDSTYDVKSRCGPPQDASRRVETRTERRRVSVPCGRAPARCDQVQEVSADVVIDEWTYDFGPQRFIHYLTFVDGRLYRVTTGSYGTNPDSD
jgi:hypothetical protein